MMNSSSGPEHAISGRVVIAIFKFSNGPYCAMQALFQSDLEPSVHPLVRYKYTLYLLYNMLPYILKSLIYMLTTIHPYESPSFDESISSSFSFSDDKLCILIPIYFSIQLRSLFPSISLLTLPPIQHCSSPFIAHFLHTLFL